MTRRQPRFLLLLAPVILALAPPLEAAPAPTVDQTLALEPIQASVDYTRPTAGGAKDCVVEYDKRSSAWVVRDGQGQVLRRFGDSNDDNLVDTWSYYKDGVEVYRDIDSDFNKKPDQYRWFHTGGTRWAVDTNEDGKIDRWRRISAHEVAEELVGAIRRRDQAAFERLLLSPAELRQLGLGTALSQQFSEKLKAAPSGFRELARRQKVVTKKSRFVDFGAARPGLAPAGAGGSSRDLVLYEGASALIDNDGVPEQVQLGVLVAVGDAWRLVEAPQVGSDGVELASVFALSRYSSGAATAGGAPPTEKMQELMGKLEKLDAEMAAAPRDQQSKLVANRARLLQELGSVTEDPSLRDQWRRQLADMLSAAVVEGTYPRGARDLKLLLDQLEKEKASNDLIAHVRFQLIWSDWGLRSQDPKLDYAEVQGAWLKQLKDFATKYPNSPDSAEALLQLGMADEFAGRIEEAEQWYTKLAREFSSSSRGRKAAGALRRLGAIGKPIPLEGRAIGGGSVNLDDYRGKHVLIQYWATWCEPCKADMAQIKQLNAKYGGRGFAVIGVNLDSSVSSAEAYLKENRLPWRNAYDEGGLEGRLATEMGVMTLPLMILVDDKGRVVRRNLHVAELDSELKRLIR